MCINSITKYFLVIFMSSLLSFTALAQTSTGATTTKPTPPVLAIQHWQTTQGIPVYFVRTPELRMLDLQLIFKGGSARDGEKAGLAQLTNALLNEGAGQLNADQIGEQFDDVGAIYSSDVSRDMALVGLRTLTDPQYLDPALQTFITVLSKPTFAAEAFSRLQKQALTLIEQESQNPATVASKAFTKVLYANHPYGHPVHGTTEAITQLTPAEVKQFYQQYYVAKNAMIAMVGNVTEQQAQQIAEQVSQSLPVGQAAPIIAPAPKLAQASQQNINFPSQQTTIVVGETAITPTDPDYFALMLGNYILGSDATSRLYTQVREQKGLVYQVSSQFIPLAARGPFLIFLQTRNAAATQALAFSRSILQDYVNSGPSAKELTDAQRHLINAFPLSIASNTDILAQIVNIGFYGLPLDYLDTYRSHIQAVTAEQIRAAFQRHIDTQKMVTVTVGQS